MGEIGISHHTFIYEMRAWHIRQVIKGYYRRNRDMWSAMRWQTYNLMCVSMADLKQAGIHGPLDLIRFPWDKDDEEGGGTMPTDEEIARLRQMMAEENARYEAEKGAAE